MTDTTVTQLIMAVLVFASISNMLAIFSAGLKILGWVTLTCQFDSGPRHQHLENQAFQSKSLVLINCLKRSQREPSGAPTDTTVTQTLFWVLCLRLLFVSVLTLLSTHFNALSSFKFQSINIQLGSPYANSNMQRGHL